jgi:hypothetical protein
VHRQEPIHAPPLSRLQVRQSRVGLALEMLQMVLRDGPLEGEVRQRAVQAEKALKELARVV